MADRDGRTPLHYCAASKFPDDMYNILCESVEDTQVEDNKGRTAADYMSNPSAISAINRLATKKGSGGSKGKRRTPPKRNSPGGKSRTPPKRDGLMNITGANIRIWIHDQDLPKLEKIVWEGQGDRLLKETSNHAKVRQFLNLVPRMMTKIKEIHNAAINADLDTLDAKSDPPDILTAKDHNGLNPLHKASALGHKEIVEFIVQKNQSTVFGQDNKGRTPLYYAAVAKDGGEVYEYLLNNGSDPVHNDQYRKTADHYRWKPNDLDLSVVHETPAAPRDGNYLDLIGNGKSRAPSRTNGRSRNPSRRNSVGDDKKSKKDAKSRRNSLSDTPTMTFKDMKDVSDADIEQFIRDGDVDSLECVVLSGRGADLQGKSSWNEQVRKFLKKVPGYMEKMTALHEASSAGDVNKIRRLTKENPKLAMARSAEGAVALHYAARSGNTQATKSLLSAYPEGLHVEDNEGRTPMHYAGMAASAGSKGTYDMLKKEGGDDTLEDLNGRTPENYRDNPVNGRNQSRAPSRAPSKAPSKAPSLAPSRNPSRAPSRAASEGKGPSRGPSRGPSQAPSRGPSRGPSQGPSRGPSRGPSQGPSRGPSRNQSRNENPSRGPSRAGSRDEDMERAITAAEDGDYSLMSDIIIMGDGQQLVGRHSKDPEVDEFLQRIPKHLESIEELHQAAEKGETRKVISLLDRKKKAQTRDANHANILHKATIYGHTDLVRYLVQNFPELLEQKDLKGRTPVHYAAVLRDGGHVYKILEKGGGKTDVKDDTGHSPQEYMDNPQILTQWDLRTQLEEGIGEGGNNRKSSRPETKGSEDEEEGSRPRVNGLSTNDPSNEPQEGALSRRNSRNTLHPDQKEDDKQGQSSRRNSNAPEAKGSRRELKDNQKGLLSRKNSRASVSSEFPGMWTEDGQYLTNALGDALIKGLSEVNKVRPRDPLAYLASCLYRYRYTDNQTKADNGKAGTQNPNSGQATIAMQTALDSTGGGEKEAVPQTRDKNGQNVLHFAAARPHGKSAFFRLISASRCSLADRDDQYRTPRDVALEHDLQENVAAIDQFVVRLSANGDLHQLKTLLLEGYDHLLDVMDEKGRNILEVAQDNKQYKTLEFLKSVINFEEKRDWLHKAIRVGSLPHVQYIADSEDIVRAKDHRGRTSLHIATLCEEKDIMEFLAKQYPVLLVVGDNLDRRPLHYAMAVEGVDQVAKVLVQAGARRTVKDLRGRTPSGNFINPEGIRALQKEERALADDSDEAVEGAR